MSSGSPKTFADGPASFYRQPAMTDAAGILFAKPTIMPPLDPGFRPLALGNRNYRRAVAAAKIKMPLAVALERNEGRVSVFDAHKPEEYPIRKDFSIIYPSESKASIPVGESNPQQFRSMFLAYAAKRLSWFFTSHPVEDDFHMQD